MKLGQQMGSELLTANHLDQSLWWAKYKNRRQIIVITLFSASTHPCYASYALQTMHLSQNHFPEP